MNKITSCAEERSGGGSRAAGARKKGWGGGRSCGRCSQVIKEGYSGTSSEFRTPAGWGFVRYEINKID